MKDGMTEFAEFVEDRQRALQRSAWLLTGDWALAEDLVQTALSRVWRRQAVRRRAIAAVLTTSVVAVLGSGVGVAVATGRLAGNPVAGQAKHAGPPRFYVELDTAGPASSEQRAQVRVTATGAVAATVHCPGCFPSAISAAEAAGGRVFFLSCQVDASAGTKVRLGTKIYRFGMSETGHVTGLRLMAGGNLTGLRAGDMAASADGSELAVAIAPAKSGPTSQIWVVSTSTGKHATWETSVFPHGGRFIPYDLSLSGDGKTLGAFGKAHCVKGARGCTSRDFEMVVTRHALTGGQLSRGGHVVFTQHQLVRPRTGAVQTADVSAAAPAVDVVIADSRGSRVTQNSISTGKPLRTLFRVTARLSLIAQLSVDPSTGFLLVTGESGGGPAGGTSFNGWINHGRLVSLKPDIRLSLNTEIW